MTEFRFPPIKFSVAARLTAGNCRVSCEHSQSQGLKPEVGFRRMPLPLLAENTPISFVEQDPGIPGPFVPCNEGPYSFPSPNFPEFTYFGQIYTPGSTQVCIPVFNAPLVIIVHARGAAKPSESTSHLEYAKLARHLNSYGYYVASMSRGLGTAWEGKFGDNLEETINFLYTKSFIAGRISDVVAIFAHSSGAASVIFEATRVKTPQKAKNKARNLAALVLLCAQVPDTWSKSKADALTKATGSFLGINLVAETDSSVAGSKSPGQPMNSTVRIYDEIGSTTGDVSSIQKAMLFLGSPQFSHYCQGTVTVRAYVAAFLNIQFGGATFYNQFIAEQVIPPSVTTDNGQPRYPQYEGRSRFSIARFEGGDVRLGSIKPSNVQVSVINSWSEDFSPHETRLLKITWNRSVPPGSFSVTSLRLDLKSPLNVSSKEYLSFRIGQGVLGGGEALDMKVKLNTSPGVLISSYGGKMAFPPNPTTIKNVDQRKSTMRTYLIPLQDFHVPITAIQSVTFDWSINPPGPKAKAIFYLDTVEFMTVQ